LGGIFGGIFCGITVRFLTKDLIPNTIAKKRAQQDTDTNVSLVFGEINGSSGFEGISKTNEKGRLII
jgi:hypothetical protein